MPLQSVSASRPCSSAESKAPCFASSSGGTSDLDGVVLVHAGKGLRELFLRLDGQDSPASVGFLFGNHRMISLSVPLRR